MTAPGERDPHADGSDDGEPETGSDGGKTETGHEEKPTLTTDPEAARDDSVGQIVEPGNS